MRDTPCLLTRLKSRSLGETSRLDDIEDETKVWNGEYTMPFDGVSRSEGYEEKPHLDGISVEAASRREGRRVCTLPVSAHDRVQLGLARRLSTVDPFWWPAHR